MRKKKKSIIRNFDYSKLKGRIIEKLGSKSKYREKLNLSTTALDNKLQNKVPFTQDEIAISIVELEMDAAQVIDYFFTIKVEKSKQN